MDNDVPPCSTFNYHLSQFLQQYPQNRELFKCSQSLSEDSHSIPKWLRKPRFLIHWCRKWFTTVIHSCQQYVVKKHLQPFFHGRYSMSEIDGCMPFGERVFFHWLYKTEFENNFSLVIGVLDTWRCWPVAMFISQTWTKSQKTLLISVQIASYQLCPQGNLLCLHPVIGFQLVKFSHLL